MKEIKVFLSKIPGILPKDIIYPEERQEEIDKVRSETVKLEKYWSWKLLEKAVNEVFKGVFSSFSFTKTPHGKWICPDFYFSITHSGGYCSVIISDTRCGVDLERHRNLSSGLEQKILTENELSKYRELFSKAEKNTYLLNKWTEKEAIFKCHGGKALLPSKLEAESFNVVHSDISLDEGIYSLAVCLDTPEPFEITLKNTTL